MTKPSCIHIVGRQNHGKTTLIVDLIEAFTTRGLRVGTIKHTSHSHELDTPGKDSHRQRIAGASPAAIVSNEVTAVYLPNLDPQRPYATLGPMFSDCDLVLVEGHLEGPGPFVEVWRRGPGTAPIAATHPRIALVISDDAPTVPVPVLPRHNLADLVLQLEHFATTGSLLPATASRLASAK